jgi:hypothetical protein
MLNLKKKERYEKRGKMTPFGGVFRREVWSSVKDG